MIKRTLFFRMMIDALDALSEKCGKLLDPHIEADLTGLFDEAIAEAKLEAVEKYIALQNEHIVMFLKGFGYKKPIPQEPADYLAELRKAAGRGEDGQR